VTNPDSKPSIEPSFKGFSLIEVLIVVVFIAGALLALAKLQGSLISGSTLSQQRAEANFLAQKLMEDLKSNAYDSASLTAGAGASQATVTGRSATFTPAYTVTDQTGPARKTITVTVSWTDAGGQTQSTTLVTQYQASQAKAAGNSLLIAESSTTSTGSSTSTSSTSTSSTSTSSTSSTSGSSTGSTTSSTSTSSSSGTPTTFSCSRQYKNSGGWTQTGYPTSSPAGNESCCTVAKFQTAFPSPSNNVIYQLTGQTCP